MNKIFVKLATIVVKGFVTGTMTGFGLEVARDTYSLVKSKFQKRNKESTNLNTTVSCTDSI